MTRRNRNIEISESSLYIIELFVGLRMDRCKYLILIICVKPKSYERVNVDRVDSFNVKG